MRKIGLAWMAVISFGAGGGLVASCSGKTDVDFGSPCAAPSDCKPGETCSPDGRCVGGQIPRARDAGAFDVWIPPIFDGGFVPPPPPQSGPHDDALGDGKGKKDGGKPHPDDD